MMKLPYFKFWDVTPVVISITDGIDVNGAPKVVATYTGKCSYVEKTRTTRTPDGVLVQLAGYLTIMGDIAPGIITLSGSVLIGGFTRNIYNTSRPRNPDGTVNHTRLELT